MLFIVNRQGTQTQTVFNLVSIEGIFKHLSGIISTADDVGFGPIITSLQKSLAVVATT